MKLIDKSLAFIRLCILQWRIILLMGLILTPEAKTTPTTIPTAFRKRGTIGTALSYAHFSTKINVTQLEDLLEHAKLSTNYSLATIKWNRGTNHEDRMKIYYVAALESLKVPSRLMNLVDLMFFQENDELKMQLSIQPNIGKRKRRQALAGAALGLSVGLSLYNLWEIKQLQSQTWNLMEENKHIIATLSDDHLMINTLSQAVTTLNKTMIRYALDLSKVSDQIALTSLFSLMNSKIESLSQEFGLFVNGLIDLTHGKLSPNLIDKTKITSAFKELDKQVQAAGYHLLHPEVSSLFKADLSYLVNNKDKTIDIWIHLPILKSASLPLYQHIKTPMLINHTHSAPLLFVSSPKGDFLAIDETTKRGVELSTSYLAGCTVEKNAWGNIYLCQDGTSILSNDIQESCLGILFTGNYDDKKLLELCDVKFISTPEYWEQVDGNSFILYSREPTKLTKICPSQSGQLQSNLTMVKDLTIVTMEPGCTAYTSRYTLYGKTEINLEQNFIYLPHELSFTKSLFDPIDLSKIYNELSTINLLPSEIHFRELQEWERTNQWRHHSLSIGGAFLMLTFTLALGVIGYLAWTYFKFRRSSIRTSGPPREDEVELRER